MENIFIKTVLAHGDVIDEHPEEDVASIDPMVAGGVVLGAIVVGFLIKKFLIKK